MKIISGKFKGKTIPFHPKFRSKPTKSITKEAIFNYLSDRFHWNDVLFLDFFAGTGNMGLEAISRGAYWVYFVDHDKTCQTFIQKIFLEWQISNATFLLLDYQDFIKKNNTFFDIIFVDPPYQKVPLNRLIPELLNFLKPKGTLILEHHFSDSFKNFEGFKEKRTFGISSFSIFEND